MNFAAEAQSLVREIIKGEEITDRNLRQSLLFDLALSIVGAKNFGRVKAPRLSAWLCSIHELLCDYCVYIALSCSIHVASYSP